MTARELANHHYQQRHQLVQATTAVGVGMWRQLDPAYLAGWAGYVGRLVAILTGAQLAAASAADGYAAAALAEQGVDAVAAGSVVASALSGVASDGRPLLSLLQEPVIAAKAAIGRGATVLRALATGQARLEMILRTQVADAGRVADGVAIAVRPRTGYVRMLTLPSCAQCVILAGRWYRYSAGFERHPQCDCIHIPAVEDTADDLRTDPRAVFESGQVQGLTEAETKAIDAGADISQVVNARRGMAAAGTTREGTSRHGIAGAQLRGAVRLMPEAIYRQATSRGHAIRLLRTHGYII